MDWGRGEEICMRVRGWCMMQQWVRLGFWEWGFQQYMMICWFRCKAWQVQEDVMWRIRVRCWKRVSGLWYCYPFQLVWLGSWIWSLMLTWHPAIPVIWGFTFSMTWCGWELQTNLLGFSVLILDLPLNCILSEHLLPIGSRIFLISSINPCSSGHFHLCLETAQASGS